MSCWLPWWRRTIANASDHIKAPRGHHIDDDTTLGHMQTRPASAQATHPAENHTRTSFPLSAVTYPTFTGMTSPTNHQGCTTSPESSFSAPNPLLLLFLLFLKHKCRSLPSPPSLLHRVRPGPRLESQTPLAYGPPPWQERGTRPCIYCAGMREETELLG